MTESKLSDRWPEEGDKSAWQACTPLSVHHTQGNGGGDGGADPLQPGCYSAVMLMGHLVSCIPMVHVIFVHPAGEVWLYVLSKQHPLVPMEHLHQGEQAASAGLAHDHISALHICDFQCMICIELHNTH